MSYRIVAFCLLTFGLGCWLPACGGGAITEESDFDSGIGGDTGHGGNKGTDATLKSGDGGTKLHGGDSGPPSGCIPKTCAQLGASCGPQGDGCGSIVECGTCTAPDTCGGGGKANTCGSANPDGGDGSTPIPTGTLSISPLNTAIVVGYGTQTPTVTYTAKVGTVSVAASFSIDLGQVAVIDPSTGVLTPTGALGGVANVTATFGLQTVTTPVTVSVSLMQNGAPVVTDAGADGGNDAGSAGGNGGVGGSLAGGPVSPTTETLLEGTPTADASLTWLYPYDKTVWPQGILPPLLQWATSNTYDSVYIHLQENAFNYQGFFSAPPTGSFVNVPIQKTAWDTLVYSNQGEPVTVTLVFTSGGVAYGPLTETWTIAQGTLTGTVYYQSYGTALVINYPGSNGYPNFGGATLAIKHGATSPVVVTGTSGINNANCRVCHSVAAGGSTLITQHGDNYNASSSYALGAGNAESPMATTPPTPTIATFGFAGISPDGTFLLSNAGPLSGIKPPATSGLFSIMTGLPITSTGLPTGFAAALPTFSPDGTLIAFNEYGVDKVSLGAMAFAASTDTFSDPLTLDTPPSGQTDLYPAFMPTNNSVVFEREVVNAGEFGATRNGAQGELWWVDLATQTAAPLANLNGTGYLPAGPNGHTSVADSTLDYEPTVNPVPSGGYAWVVFTSRRMYGNVATQKATLSDPRNYNATLTATTKKLWVAAIDLNAPAGTDPSHPAFYLPAQELLAGNSRGYWVVDPCEASGVSCLTGDQCCSGYCGQGDGGLVCGTQPPGCAVLGNKCTVSTDCCGSTTGISCIDGFCAEPGKKEDAGVCVPTTCSKLGINCGPAGDGCGNLLECGTCAAPKTCGGGGVSGVCGGMGAPP